MDESITERSMCNFKVSKIVNGTLKNEIAVGLIEWGIESPSNLPYVCVGDWRMILSTEVTIIKQENTIYSFSFVDDTFFVGGNAASIADSVIQSLEGFFETHAIFVFQEEKETFNDTTNEIDTLLSALPAVPKDIENTNISSLENTERVLEQIRSGSNFIAGSINSGSQKAAAAIFLGSLSLSSKIEPSSSEPMKMDKAKATMSSVHTGTSKLVSYTESSVDALVDTVESAARGMVIKSKESEKGNKLLEKPSIQKACKIGHASADGLYAITDAFVQAGKTIGHAAAAGSKMLMTKKYGEDAGDVTYGAIMSATNVYSSVTAVNHIGRKAVLKAATAGAVAGIIANTDTPTSQITSSPPTITDVKSKFE